MASSKGIFRILVADDDVQLGDFVKDLLQGDGHYVTLCRDGQAALRALGTAKYSVAIFDNRMPRKTGVEALLQLRRGGHGIPVVLMSSFFSDKDREACEGLERVAFLHKPFGIDELRGAIEKVAARVRA